ncbi:MAG: NAD(P)H-dependent oxidoreductase, partial [Elusimicrobia bacterium]|nr:NAD(P)H-dependent oxidoreductase [Elusimicrobiota bacterium]
MNTIEEAVAPGTLTGALERRYAVKRFDPAGRIPPQAWAALEKSLQLAPSSYGLQPWKFFVVGDPRLREELRKASWDQSQVTEADKFVVFAARTGVGPRDVERHIARVAEVRGTRPESLSGYRDMMLAKVAKPGPEVDSWAARQVYIALGVLLSAAAVLGVDATPMEGLDPARYDALLGLRSKGYRTLCAAALGVRSPEDAYAAE